MIWTIYNHGTGASSLKAPASAEIVNLFGNNDRGELFNGKIITEGAGSIGDPKDLVRNFRRDAQTGQYSFVDSQGGSGKVSRGVQAATGAGVEKNVANTLELLRALNLAGRCPTGINMIGWSRGAVTCIRLAYHLSQSQDPVLRGIPINIFAVDPVAGFGHNREVDAITVNSNVRYYLATMSTGEKRRFFKPIAGQRLHIANPGATQAWVIPLPGVHNETATNNNNVGKLTFDLAYRFLTACGTNLASLQHYKLNESRAWGLYEEIMVGKAVPKTTGKLGVVTLGGTAYNRTKEAAALSTGERFFINYHAEKVFERVYPVCYDAYFSAANHRTRNSQAWAARYSPGIVAEQKQRGMSQALIWQLDALAPGGVMAQAPASVNGMVQGLGLVG